MFSVNENNYIEALVNSYVNKGYSYYLVHTITDNNNYDICAYFSKDLIDSMNDHYFDVEKGIKVLINTKSKSTYSYDSRDSVEAYNGTVNVDVAEFIYTNAKCEYSLSTIPLNPDITIDFKENRSSSFLIIITTIILLYIFVRDLFKLGG